MLKHSVTARTVCYCTCAAVNCSCDVCIIPDKHTYGQRSRAAKRLCSILLLRVFCRFALLGTGSTTVMLPMHFQCTAVSRDWAFLTGRTDWFARQHCHCLNYTTCRYTLAQLQLLILLSDSNIILMLADDMACNARNPRPGT